MLAGGNKQKKLNTKRLMTIIVVCIVLVIIPLGIWLLGFNTMTQNDNFSSYQTKAYTFYYPKNWTVTKSAMTNINGTAYFLQPSVTNIQKSTHVFVEVAPANPSSINDMTNAFTTFKYTEADTTVNGIKAQKYTNVVPSSEGVLHSIAYVFISKNNIYLIKLGYKQNITDSQLEDEFTQIVNTVAVN